MNISPPKKKLHIPWQGVFSLLMYVLMYLPIAVLAFYSFNQSPYSAAWEGFTWEWYQKLFTDERILLALKNSLIVAFCAVSISAVLGTLMAVGLARYRFPLKGLYRGISYLPLIIPDIAIAVATLVFLTAFAIPLSIWTIV
ncbi:MAG: spermidine/putrescine ABC transporter permease PotC, partial [Cyanobacteria bacterium J06635_10]